MSLNSSIKDINVDINCISFESVVFAKQNDNVKRQVKVHLKNNGQKFQISSSQDSNIVGYIQGKTDAEQKTLKRVKFKYDISNSSINVTEGTVTIDIKSSMVKFEGTTVCEIALFDKTKPEEVICTANFYINVQQSPFNIEDEMEEDEYPAIQNIYAEIKRIHSEVESDKNEAVSAANIATSQAQNAQIAAEKVQAIVANNESYTKQEADYKYTVAPRKEATSDTGEMELTDADNGLAGVSMQGNSFQYESTGKNLFDFTKFEKSVTSASGIKLVNNMDGTFSVTTSSNPTQSVFHVYIEYSHEDSVRLFKAGTYRTIKKAGYFPYSYITFKGASFSRKEISSNNGTQLTLTEEDVANSDFYATIGFYAQSGATINATTLKPFFTISDEEPTEEDFEPYSGGEPGPNPDYPFPVESVGDIPKDSNGVEIRNLLDEEWLISQPESAWVKQTNEKYYIDVTNMFLNQKKIYIKSSKNTSGYTLNIQENYSSLTNSVSFTTNLQGVNITTGKVYFAYYSKSGAKFDDVLKAIKENNLMVTTASEIDEYRPYIGENNGLIKIDSDSRDGRKSTTWVPLKEPLRKIGDVADEILKDGTVVQNTGSVNTKDIVMSADDIEEKYITENPPRFSFLNKNNYFIYSYSGNNSKGSLCDKLNNNGYNKGFENYAIGGSISIGIKSSRLSSVTKEALFEWLQSNQMIFYGQLKTPTTYIIPRILVETYDPTTDITVQSEIKPSMTVDYKIAISSILKRLEALEQAEVNRM